MNKAFGSNRNNKRNRIVKLRTKDLLSWVDIAAALNDEVSPRTCRRIFEEKMGKHQHHDHLPGKGGRYPTGQYINETIVVWVPELAPGQAPVLDGSGSVNTWVKVEAA